MNSIVTEFREFLVKQNALALAVGVVIGGAIGKVVSGIVDDLFMPVIGLLLPGGDWRAAQVWVFKVGDLLGRVIDFLIVSVVVFIVLKIFLREKPKAPTTKSCPQCLELVPLQATRCRACTSALS